MSDKLLFSCRVCGVELPGHPVVTNDMGEQVGVQGVCEAHCEDHDYQHDGYRSFACIHCDAEPPDDWFYSDDDVGFSGGGYVPGAPIGIPASAMNGNAMQAHKDPAAWDNWVAFCNSWGHP